MTLQPLEISKHHKHYFEIRKLALVVVIDERDSKGEAVRLDIELGPYLFPTIDKCAESLKEDLPLLLAEINQRGALEKGT